MDEPHFIVEDLIDQDIYYDYWSPNFKEFKIDIFIGGDIYDVMLNKRKVVNVKDLNHLFICDTIDITVDNADFDEQELFDFLKTLKFNYLTIDYVDNLFVFKNDVKIEFKVHEFISALTNKLSDLIIHAFSDKNNKVTTRGPKSDLEFVIEYVKN